MATQYVGKKFAKVLKDELKKGRMGIYRSEDDYIYAMQGAFALKIPHCIYASVLQPITLRDMPERGAGFWIGATADGAAPADKSVMDIYENAKSSCCVSAVVTPYLYDFPFPDDRQGRILAVTVRESGKAIVLNDAFLGMFSSPRLELRAKYAGVYAPVFIEDGCIEAVICPIRMDEREAERIEALAASYYQVKSEVA